jgi:pimeloyl-ACP methyl ester carboxylesterase
VEFRTISSGGRRHVVSQAGEGADIVLVHGFPDTPYSWSEIEAALVGAGWRVTVPWLRGYHEETIVAGRRYDPETLGRDALELLDAIDAPRAVLVGHDWGALLTYVAATLAPDRVRAIVTSAIPHPSLLRRTPAALWATRHFLGLKLPWAARTCRRDDFAYLGELYERWAPSWSGPERDDSLRHAKQALSSQATLEGRDRLLPRPAARWRPGDRSCPDGARAGDRGNFRPRRRRAVHPHGRAARTAQPSADRRGLGPLAPSRACRRRGARAAEVRRAIWRVAAFGGANRVPCKRVPCR